jgi:hypothetical protein
MKSLRLRLLFDSTRVQRKNMGKVREKVKSSIIGSEVWNRPEEMAHLTQP